jgi:hypothetical protein
MDESVITEFGLLNGITWAGAPPQKVLISYANMGKGRAEADVSGDLHQLYELWVPPSLYGVTGNKVYYGYVALDDPAFLWPLTLPNGMGGTFCNYAYGDSVVRAITGFWSSGFNQNAGHWQQHHLERWDHPAVLEHLKTANAAKPVSDIVSSLHSNWEAFLRSSLVDMDACYDP